MSRYDDDYDDNEDERDDDDELEGEDGVRRSTSNPFSKPSSVRGAGLPQRPPPNQSGSVPSPIRSGGMGGPNNNVPNRSGNPSQSGSGSSSNVQPYQRNTVPPRSPVNRDDDKDEETDRTAAVNRVLGSFGQKHGSEKPEDRRDEKPASGMYGSRLGGNDRDRLDDRQDDRSSGLTRGLGASTTRLGGNDERRDERSSGGLSSRFGGGDKNDAKKDSKPGGGLSGLTSRLGGGDKNDAKKDSKPGGGLGGLTSRFGGGDKKDVKPNANAKPGGLGGLTSRFGGGDKNDAKQNAKPGGGLGGLTSRLGGGKSDDRRDDRPSAFGSNRLGDQSSNRQSPLGGTLNRGNKPEPSASSFGGTNTRAPFGSGASNLGGSSNTRTLGGKKPAPSLGERLRGLNPFGQKQDARQTRARASKAPRVEQGGLSLDSKLDILGVTLVLGSLVLVLSSLSPTKGALTESINHNLSYVFGWGAIFVLMVTFAIGVWLILRHFGDDAPVISRTRLVGMALLFVSALVAAQFIDSFQYKVGANQDYLGTLKNVFLPIAYNLGRGGGWVGGEIYFVLLSNFGEIGGFLLLFIPIIVGIMLTLKISAADLAMIVISNGRNLGDAFTQRRQRATAQRAAQQQTLAAATQQISVTKPADALPVPVSSPALPAPSAEHQRRIPITTAGRTSTVPFRAQQLAEVQAAEPVPVAQEKSGLFSRVRGALPGRGKATADKPAAEKASALRGRLFSNKQESSGMSAPLTPATATPAQPAPAQLQPQMQAQQITPPPPVQAKPASAEETPRLSDLLRRPSATPAPTPVAPGSVQPYQRPSRPEQPLNGERKPADTAPLARPETVQPSQAIPDLQSRLRTLRETGTAPATGAPTRPTASPAFGKPDDPPFAVPQRTTIAPPAASEVTPPPPPRRPKRDWKLPDPAALLSSGVDQEPDHQMLLKRAHIIEETLSSFGAPGRVVDVRTGPVVTQFGVEPDYVPGRGGKKNRVKVGAIAALDKDLQLALGAKSIRIEAPVPGKGYVGVEVPNEKPEIVHLRDVLESPEFKKIKSPLAIALGQGVDGTPVAADLTSMPHLLIAGTTGSGKSVLVNAIIASMLLNNTPRQMKFIMVDPKRVELTQYNGVPHLIAPVVVELERIVSVLKWVTREMDERYRRFSNAAARNIEDYNKHLPSTEEPMPYIVVIIDELADLMMLAPDDTERVITRIAALARATGIHLVIATQRPSVDVVTGLIKANFPARVAFAVAGNTDSRVILDQPGAERLLGRGDMLYMSGDSPAPVRLQGVYVSDNEISNITRFWRGQMSEEDLIAASRPMGASISPDDSRRNESGSVIMRGNSAPPKQGSDSRSQVAFWDSDDEDDADEDDDVLGEGEDEMYEQAVELVRRLNKASVSLLQRRLRIGYTRAARMIDTMEERGVIGPATEGSKPRDVLPVR